MKITRISAIATSLILITSITTSQIFTAEAQTPPPGPFTPPAFSQNINSIFPNAPFVTCLQGQFEPPSQPPAPPPAHFWFIKPESLGTVTIDVRAVTVNTAETGSIIALLFDTSTIPSTQIGSVTVAHPTGSGASPGDENIGFITFSADPTKIYRLDVLLGPPAVGTQQAHHYKLSFSGVPVDVGINSPTYRYFEHNLPSEVFQVNVDQGEPFTLNILTESPDQGANQATSITVEIRDRGTLTTLFGPTTLTLPPPSTTPGVSVTTVSIPTPFQNSAGQLVLFLAANGHYKLDKTTGSDHGIYFETCPPPPPPPPPAGEPKTIGFWKNHESDTTAKLPQTLGAYVVNTFATAKAVFDAADAKNAHNMLAAQLLAAKLNKANGIPSSCVDSAIATADTILSNAGYNGPNTTTAPQKSAKNAVNAVKDQLDAYNNNGC
jgi:hypothetical protein